MLLDQFETLFVLVIFVKLLLAFIVTIVLNVIVGKVIDYLQQMNLFINMLSKYFQLIICKQRYYSSVIGNCQTVAVVICENYGRNFH
ncbi:hypothetical protein T4D_11516 [Trichinella pseudospiralis]|uniref:Uncharacterized protein n=1 Tax=Trichinella pseudospiralis TaxID=6337 RepID=A0A0V1FNG3_TRIPS|nr:hypothetical protein T4D_11516 [Trichinella pseudospiralis]